MVNKDQFRKQLVLVALPIFLQQYVEGDFATPEEHDHCLNQAQAMAILIADEIIEKMDGSST